MIFTATPSAYLAELRLAREAMRREIFDTVTAEWFGVLCKAKPMTHFRRGR